MKKKSAANVKNWIKSMGLKLTKTHLVDRRQRKVNYYTLDNFGIYEEIISHDLPDLTNMKFRKYTSWTPAGDPIEINSAKDVSLAYQDYVVAAH